MKQHDTTRHSELGKLPIPGGFALPVKPVFKKSPNRNMQGTPPAPPAPPGKTTGEAKPLPVPPGKTVSDPKPPLVPPGKTTTELKPSCFSAAISATPTKVDKKPEFRPKPVLPIKTDLKRTNEKPKPVLPMKHDTRQSDVKSNSPVTVKPSDNESHDDGIGIAGALKARFEAIDQDKNTTDTQKPKPNVNPKVNLKPVPNQSKPTLPVSSGGPGVPFKPNNLNKAPQMPKPSWAKNKEEPASPSANKPTWAKNNAVQVKSKIQPPHMPNKPSWAKNKEEPTLLTTSKPAWAKDSGGHVQSRKSELVEDGDGAHKVSDLANVLKAKFEKRKTQSDTGEIDIVQRDYKPAPASKSPLKPFQKPQRPGTPPSHQPQGRRLPSTSFERTSSPVLADSSSLDPTKYSLRPLPPQPKSPLKPDIPSDKHTNKPLPSFPGKPKSSSAIGNLKKVDSRNNTDSDDESKPAGVSNLANALKAKLGAIGSAHTSVSPKPKQKSEQATIEHSNMKSDIENNNAAVDSSSDDNVYCAIADFAGDNEGEIKLVIGQEVQLLETADGWWYVSNRSEEGWAPSSYLEKREIGQGQEPTSWTASESVSSKQTMYRMCSNFVGENEGELSVDVGQDVNVVEMPDRDWWFVEVDGKTGWIPSSFLEEVTI